MKEFLQGKWLGHPLHGVLVHLPMALWPAALVFDLLANVGPGGNAFVQAAFYAIALGLASAALAVPTGLADWLAVKPERPAWKLGLYHLILNAVAVALWVVNLIVRVNTFQTAAQVPTVGLVLSIVGTALILVSGYLGGRMVYAYGVSIARFSKDRWRRVAQAGGANLPSQQGG